MALQSVAINPANRSGTKKNSSQQQSQEPEQETNEQETRKYYKETLYKLKQEGVRLRSDKDQPNFSNKPSWFNETLFENAKCVYARHFMAINFAHLSGLLLLVRVNSIFRTLNSTGKSDSVSKLFNRYYQTIIHVKKWYEGDIFDESSEAHRSLLIVRGMHNKVSTNLNDNRNANFQEANKGFDTRASKNDQAHLSEYDIMITQFAFVGFIVMRANSVGLISDFSQHDLDSVLHFWRVIGYYLGASEKYNLCSRNSKDILGLCEAITEIEFKQSIQANSISSPPGIMSINIIRSIKFIPMLTIYGMLKYLYKLLNIDTGEFETRATRYTRLSHYLIEAVMTRLLGYKFLRMFNNGLTRLSLYLVGTIQERFSNYLETKYGQELKTI